MTVTIEAAALARAMKSAASIVESAHTIPVLANVRIDAASGDEMEIVTSNLDVEYRQRVPVVSGKGLATTVDARRLSAMAGAVEPGAQMAMELKDGRLAIRSGRSRWALPVLPVEDFPAMPFGADQGEITVPGKDLAALIARTAWSASTELATRAYLCGIFLDPEDGKVRCTAANGHAFISIVTDIAWPGDAPPVIVPTKYARMLERIAADAETVCLCWDDRKIRTSIADLTLTGKLVEGSFPDYRRIIPAPGESPISVDPEHMRRALRRIELVSSEKTRCIVVDVRQGIVDLSVADPSHGSANEEVIADCEALHRTGFNAAYLGGALEAIGGDTVQIHHASPDALALIRRAVPDGAICGVMPMRV